MTKAKRYRKHYHYTVSTWDNGELIWSTCNAPTQPKAVEIWYNFYFRNNLKV